MTSTHPETRKKSTMNANTTQEQPVNDRILRAARGETVDPVPVWIMRQAGRYLPEYRDIRKGRSFFDTCRNPDLVAEITMQPLERFPLDAAILFSDILVVPQALGMQVEMVKGRGPVFPHPLRTASDVKRLQPEGATDRLSYVYDGISTTRKALAERVPLIGFSGAPWTLMAYMIEGQGSKTFSKAKSWLYGAPSDAHRLLEVLTAVIGDYLVLQVEAGAQILQVFDSWSGLLGPEVYREFGTHYLRILADDLSSRVPDVPSIIFAKGAHYALEDLAATSFDVISLDWTTAPAGARARVGSQTALQGNLDPSALFATPEKIARHAREMVHQFGKTAYIANLGHGLYPNHDPEHVAAFVDAVHSA